MSGGSCEGHRKKIPSVVKGISLLFCSSLTFLAELNIKFYWFFTYWYDYTVNNFDILILNLSFIPEINPICLQCMYIYGFHLQESMLRILAPILMIEIAF